MAAASSCEAGNRHRAYDGRANSALGPAQLSSCDTQDVHFFAMRWNQEEAGSTCFSVDDPDCGKCLPDERLPYARWQVRMHGPSVNRQAGGRSLFSRLLSTSTPVQPAQHNSFMMPPAITCIPASPATSISVINYSPLGLHA